MPKMISVKSSLIEAIGYDNGTWALHVHFIKAPTISYVYQNVPMKLFEQMLKAKSAGIFFKQCIEGRFAFTKEPRSGALAA